LFLRPLALPRPTRQRWWSRFGQSAPDCDQPPRSRPPPLACRGRDLSISSALHRNRRTSAPRAAQRPLSDYAITWRSSRAEGAPPSSEGRVSRSLRPMSRASRRSLEGACLRPADNRVQHAARGEVARDSSSEERRFRTPRRTGKFGALTPCTGVQYRALRARSLRRTREEDRKRC